MASEINAYSHLQVESPWLVLENGLHRAVVVEVVFHSWFGEKSYLRQSVDLDAKSCISRKLHMVVGCVGL